MKSRLLIFLVLLNLALFGGGFYFLNRFFSNLAPSSNSPVKVDPRNRLKLAKPKLAAIPAAAPVEKIVYVTNQFHWSQVESGDYRIYIANLRAIHCPENTIKDIILTDVMKLYAAQRGRFYHNGREFKFWETDEKRKLNAKQVEEREKQLASIDKEIPSVLRELLGINYEREINKYFVDANEDDRRLNFIPAEKRGQLMSLREEIEGMKERVLEAANGNPSAADLEALQKIETHRKTELEKLLSGSELAEFELRTSETADRLRAELIGFNPTESEFREIFERQKAVDEKFASTKSTDERATAQRAVQEEIKQQLGPERYADYERAQNPDFRNTCVFAEVYQLPVSTAQTIFDIKQVAEAERQSLLSNKAIEDRDRLEALKAIQSETEKALRQTMGTKIYASYSQGTGSWVQNLGSTK